MAFERYIHVLAKSGRHFQEVFRAYEAMAARSGDTVAMLPAESWSAERPEWQDPRTAVILWWSNGAWAFQDKVPVRRKAFLALWYLESACDPARLCPMQRRIFEGFRDNLSRADLVIACNPSGAEALAPFSKRTAFAPIGYDPEFMGRPNYSEMKKHDLGTCLGITGRREWIMPAVDIRFGPRALNALGLWYGDLRRAYDSCRAELYVAHSDEPGFPGMRIWHAAATSAALVTEKRDAWPMVAGRHYIELEDAIPSAPEAFAEQVDAALSTHPVKSIARTCHAEMAAYTPEKATEFIVRAIG